MTDLPTVKVCHCQNGISQKLNTQATLLSLENEQETHFLEETKMAQFCVVCGSNFVPVKGANLCCSKCGWSQIDAIFREKDKYDPHTGHREKNIKLVD